MSTSPERTCPSEADLVRFADGELDGERRVRLTAHLDRCETCRELVALAAGDAEPAGPTTIGRYRLVGVLGSGAMGIVHAAEDPQLGRVVALKLVLDSDARLVREARAMAKLSHPNVVPVFDVGEVDGSAYIVMERVEGPDLGRWSVGRSWRELLACFIGCGRGLAAAHAAGLVHRDFKPSNVLVDGRGCPKVTDFGLVGEPLESLREDSQPLEDAETVRTRSGAIAGTPAYMSPEQFKGSELSAATDQFSFCVALAEALSGERPTRGSTVSELAESASSASRRVASISQVAPARVVQVLRRGLAAEPADRFPSMLALVDQLERALRRSPSRGRWARRAAFAVGLGACGLLAASAPRASDSAAEVDASAPPFFVRAEVSRLEATLREAEREIAEADFEGAARRLEQEADALDALAWDPTWVDGQLLRAQCEGMAGQREAQRARLRQAHYRAAGAGLDRRATQAATSLIEAHAAGGDYAAAEHWFDIAVGTARRLEDPILEAEALRRAAFVAMLTSGYDDALSLANRAHALFVANPDANIDGRLAELDGIRGYVALFQGRMDAAARAFGDQLRRLDDRFGTMHPKRAPVLLGLIQVAIAQREWDEAKRLLDAREQVVAGTFGRDSVQFGRNLAQRSHLAEARGEVAAALARAHEARQTLSDALGAHHPDVARQHARIGRLHARLGDHLSAHRAYARALDECVEFAGEESYCAVVGHTNVGHALLRLDRVDDAVGHLQAAFELAPEVLGPEYAAHVIAKNAAVGMGEVHLRHGEYDDARVTLRGVLERAASGPDDAQVHGRAAYLLAQALLEDPRSDRDAWNDAQGIIHQALDAWASEADAGTEAQEARDWVAQRSVSPAAARSPDTRR